MIGLTFLAIGLLWLAFSIFVGLKLPKWLGIQSVAKQRAVTVAALVVFLVGPFVDHIVGMRQFRKLCDEQTGLQIYPNAAHAKRAVDQSTSKEPLRGYLIPILQRTDSLVNAETGDVISRYQHFSTQGGRVGGALRLGGVYECAVFQSNHPDHDRYRALRKQFEIISGARPPGH
ncbi:MAG TPA: hypothetical protein PLY54_09875 [Ottowia sp.]|nr:hypothetical protein [Ottowia sp.]